MSQTADVPDQPGAEQGKGINSGTEPIIQQPGEVIAPEIPDGYVEKIMEEMYGMRVTRCKQLNGYDDKNYLVIVAPTSSNPYVTSPRPEGYMMKVVNTIDTRRPAILYSQIEVMRHLLSKGIVTQEPVLSCKGDSIVFYDFPPPDGKGQPKRHALGLRTFVEGSIVYDVTLTQDLCYEIGKFQAAMTKALEDFHHPFYDTFDSLWSLNSLPKLADFIHVITDVRHRKTVEEVVEQFSSQVLSCRQQLRKGYIHGDPNEQNILVRPDGPDGKYSVAGILDFQDVANAHPLYDLGMNIAYIMLQATTFDPLEVGGHIVAGYVSVLELPEVERSLLRLVAAGRLVQSLVLGAYNHSLDPTNDYLLVTAKRGWGVLHQLWDMPAEMLSQKWDQIELNYQNRLYKG